MRWQFHCATYCGEIDLHFVVTMLPNRTLKRSPTLNPCLHLVSSFTVYEHTTHVRNSIIRWIAPRYYKHKKILLFIINRQYKSNLWSKMYAITIWFQHVAVKLTIAQRKIHLIGRFNVEWNNFGTHATVYDIL